MKMLRLCLFVLFLVAGTAAAAELKVVRGVITTQIINREPVDDVKRTSAAVGRLYCFTRISGAESETTIAHVWYHNGQKAFEEKFPVKAASWRAYSAKTMTPEMRGEWKVDVVDAAGKVLATIPFRIN